MWASSDGSVVGCERVLDVSVVGWERRWMLVGLGCERGWMGAWLEVRVVAMSNGSMVKRWRNDGELNQNKDRKTLSEITAL